MICSLSRLCGSRWTSVPIGFILMIGAGGASSCVCCCCFRDRLFLRDLLFGLAGFIVWGLSDRRVRHIAALTWKAAVRLRFIWVMVILLLLAVGGLPAMLRDDGSAKGMAQIILTYTLSMTTGILGSLHPVAGRG